MKNQPVTIVLSILLYWSVGWWSRGTESGGRCHDVSFPTMLVVTAAMACHCAMLQSCTNLTTSKGLIRKLVLQNPPHHHHGQDIVSCPRRIAQRFGTGARANSQQGPTPPHPAPAPPISCTPANDREIHCASADAC